MTDLTKMSADELLAKNCVSWKECALELARRLREQEQNLVIEMARHQYARKQAEADLEQIKAKCAVMVEAIKIGVKEAILSVDYGSPLENIWEDVEIEIDNEIAVSSPASVEKLLAIKRAAEMKAEHCLAGLADGDTVDELSPDDQAIVKTVRAYEKKP